MSHTCRAFLVRCMDFRLWNDIDSWAEKKNLIGDCDLISLGGTFKDLLSSDKTVRNYLLRQIDISYNLHEAREGYILDHMDCGAWGGAKAFKNEEADYRHHARVLQDVREIINKEYPDFRLHLVIIKMSEGRVTEFVEID